MMMIIMKIDLRVTA